jgi:hypothetical protein
MAGSQAWGLTNEKNKHRKGQRSLAERRFIHALIHEADIAIQIRENNVWIHVKKTPIHIFVETTKYL